MSTLNGETSLRLSGRALKLLRCPRCQGELTASGAQLECAGSCHAVYPCGEGIPVLIDEARSVFRTAACVEGSKPRAPTFYSRAKRWGLERLPRIESNVGAREALARFCGVVRKEGRKALVLNIGEKHAASVSAITAPCYW